jgi:pSer/pThr/pTyr-binding forkhead associated (FHA) protein
MQLVVTRGKHQGSFIPVDEKIFTIGRDETCHLRPHSDEVSRRHAELKLISGLVIISDLGSRNGTWVNGQRVTSQLCLRHGDRIEIGPLGFTVLLEEARNEERTRRTAEDEVAAWLIGDEEGSRSTELTVPTGDTAESAVDPGKPARRGNPTAAHSAEGPRDEAYDLLRSMSARGTGPD